MFKISIDNIIVSIHVRIHSSHGYISYNINNYTVLYYIVYSEKKKNQYSQ